MHKHEGNTSAARKKKTKNEQKHDQRRAAQKKEEAKKAAELSWNDIADLHNKCLGMLSIPGKIVPVLRDKEVQEKVSSLAQLNRHSSILVRDTEVFQTKLRDVRSQWEGKEGRAASPDEVIEAIFVGEGYRAWIDEFTEVVLPTVGSILDMVNDVLPEESKIVI